MLMFVVNEFQNIKTMKNVIVAGMGALLHWLPHVVVLVVRQTHDPGLRQPPALFHTLDFDCTLNIELFFLRLDLCFPMAS